jgi:CheY-like chemotaxis protein
LTANALAHQVEHYRAVGMDGFVAKPIEITRLFGAMRAALEPDTQAALRLATMSAREPNAQ